MLDHVHNRHTYGRRPVIGVQGTGRLISIAVVAAAATACSASQPTPPSPPATAAPTSTPEAPTAAALAAYGEFWRVSEAALAEPSAQDWKGELDKVASGQALNDSVLEIQNYASVPAHLEGSISHSPRLDPQIPASNTRVAVLDCVDISKSQLLRDSDKAILNDVQNQVLRYHYRAQVVRNNSGTWTVETTAPALDEPC